MQDSLGRPFETEWNDQVRRYLSADEPELEQDLDPVRRARPVDAHQRFPDLLDPRLVRERLQDVELHEIAVVLAVRLADQLVMARAVLRVAQGSELALQRLDAMN